MRSMPDLTAYSLTLHLASAFFVDLRKRHHPLHGCRRFYHDLQRYSTNGSGPAAQSNVFDFRRYIGAVSHKRLTFRYSVFDTLTERHGVFKVETIGDAYMIVGGAPNKTQFHAELVCDCALSVISSTLTMVEQSTRKPIRIRAGKPNVLSL